MNIEKLKADRRRWLLQATNQEQEIRHIKESLDIAWALVMQSVMLEQAEANPEITSFTFEAELEYDDEDGYFWCPQFYVVGNDRGSDDEELVDELMEYRGDEDQVALAFDSKSSSEGEITVGRLRELWKGESNAV
jgi:hypothetical protein